MSAFDVLANGSPDEERMEHALGVSLAVDTDAESGDARIAEAAKRDPAAFGELYERYYQRVYRFVYHRVGNSADAEDITAIVFMKALEGLPAYESRRNGFAPWIFRITRNAVVDHYRRQRRQCPLDDLPHESQDGDPMIGVLGDERREELRVLVQHLSAEQRDVVLMRFAADLTFSEIAATLKKNEPAVRMLLHRGLRKLKTVMDNA